MISWILKYYSDTGTMRIARYESGVFGKIKIETDRGACCGDSCFENSISFFILDEPNVMYNNETELINAYTMRAK